MQTPDDGDLFGKYLMPKNSDEDRDKIEGLANTIAEKNASGEDTTVERAELEMDQTDYATHKAEEVEQEHEDDETDDEDSETTEDEE